MRCRKSVAKSGGGGGSKSSRTPGARQPASSKPLSVRDQADAVFAQFIGHEILRHGDALVPMDEREDAAPRAAGGDVAQPLRRGVGEIHRERRDDQEMIFLRHAAGLRVVFRDGGVFVAQIHLDDFLHVLVQFGELFLELRRLRPDAAVEAALLVIGQVRQRGEILAQPTGSKMVKLSLPGGVAASSRKMMLLITLNASSPLVLPDSNRMEPCSGTDQRQRRGKRGRAKPCQARVLRQRADEIFHAALQPRELGGILKVGRRRPVLPLRLRPRRTQFLGGVVGRAQLLARAAGGVVSRPPPIPASAAACSLSSPVIRVLWRSASCAHLQLVGRLQGGHRAVVPLLAAFEVHLVPLRVLPGDARRPLGQHQRLLGALGADLLGGLAPFLVEIPPGIPRIRP